MILQISSMLGRTLAFYHIYSSQWLCYSNKETLNLNGLPQLESASC